MRAQFSNILVNIKSVCFIFGFNTFSTTQFVYIYLRLSRISRWGVPEPGPGSSVASFKMLQTIYQRIITRSFSPYVHGVCTSSTFKKNFGRKNTTETSELIYTVKKRRRNNRFISIRSLTKKFQLPCPNGHEHLKYKS